jgi:general secretion pathway protein J
MATNAIRRPRGFTLVEVLVALVIMALMAMMSWRGLDAIIRTRDISQLKLEQTMRLQTVMAQWEQDLQAVQDIGGVPPLRFDGASLRLTRRRPEGMQIVVWSKQGTLWTRWESPTTTRLNELQESYMRSLQLQPNAAGLVRALEGLSGWQLYFYRGNGWSNAQSSDDLAPAAAAPPASGASGPAPVTSTAALPTGVKLAIQFEPGSGFSGALTRAVAMGPQP